MKIRKALSIAILTFAATPLYAGVAMDLVTKDASGAATEAMKVFAQSGKIRMDDVAQSSGEDMSMIFLGQKFIVLSHSDKTYIVMDEAMVAELGSQMSVAMQQMEAQLAGMPPEQRAMVEQMMKGQMQGMMGGDAAAPPKPTVKRTGSGQWQGQPCTEYTVYEGGEKTQEICAAPLGDIGGADEALRAFENMAGFMNKLADAMPEPMASGMGENPMGLIDQINGFPVRTVDFVNGQASYETTLESVVELALDDSIFAPPAGYTQQKPFTGR